MRHQERNAPVILLATALAACASATAPPAAPEVTINVETTGGIAGMHWSVILDGSRGEVRCVDACPWGGPTGRVISDDEIEDLAGRFVRAGIRLRPTHDYGVCSGCADQFHHVIRYRDATGEYRVDGDGPSLPPAIESAVLQIIFVPSEPETPS